MHVDEGGFDSRRGCEVIFSWFMIKRISIVFVNGYNGNLLIFCEPLPVKVVAF